MVHIDFETRSRVELKDVGLWVYSCDPSTEVLCICYALDDGPIETIFPDRLNIEPLQHLRTAITMQGGMCAHNAMFEWAMWNNCIRKLNQQELHEIPCNVVNCTMAQAAMHALPRSLGGCAEALGLAEQKDKSGQRVMLKLCKPGKNGMFSGTEDEFAQLYAYCAKDVKVEREIHKKLAKLSPNEQKLYSFDLEVNSRGVKLDRLLIEKAVTFIEKHKLELDKETHMLTDGRVGSVTQRADVLRELDSIGEYIDGYTKADVKATIGHVTDATAKRILEIRQELGRTSVAKYPVMLDMLGEGDRVRDILQYHGANTGRWSGKGVQFHNFPKDMPKNAVQIVEDIKTLDYEGFTMLYPELFKTLSGILRATIIPEEGHMLLVADYSAIEARVVAWLADEDTALKIYRAHGDIYITMAEAIYDTKGIMKKDPRRQLGKQAVLGCGYGMGHKKFYETCMKYGIVVDELLCEKAVQTFRTTFSKIRTFWYDLERAAVNAVRNPKHVMKCKRISYFYNGSFLFCKLPSGRVISYYQPQVKESDEGRPELTYTVEYQKKLIREKIYGGLLTENCTQAVARDIMAAAMLKLDQAGFNVVLTVHDEIICEAKNKSIKAMLEIMSQLPDWACGCPITAEGFAADRYKKD